ncbi:MAG: hypothetical protein M3Q15_02620 [Pseudomonadota bacterium]|nr:hypothetical protein [Pseudomonadota bacterium]
MLRKIMGVVAGIVAAFATIWLVELIGHQIFPVAGNIDLGDRESLTAFMASLPVGALLFVVISWFAGALVGGVVAARITGERWAAWVVAGVIAFASIANVLMFPHPLWVKIGGFVAPLLGGWIAARTARPIVVTETAPVHRDAADADV